MNVKMGGPEEPRARSRPSRFVLAIVIRGLAYRTGLLDGIVAVRLKPY